MSQGLVPENSRQSFQWENQSALNPRSNVQDIPAESNAESDSQDTASSEFVNNPAQGVADSNTQSSGDVESHSLEQTENAVSSNSNQSLRPPVYPPFSAQPAAPGIWFTPAPAFNQQNLPPVYESRMRDQTSAGWYTPPYPRVMGKNHP